MAAILTTGVPGAGKTLLTIRDVEARRVAEGREVYYHNIRDLTLPWHKLEDPKKWHECPPGAIIVIDECQEVFPTRGAGQKVPDHVELFAKHRHQGFDIYLVTQHPAKLDKNIRTDVETHRHLMRKFGSHWCTMHTWAGVRENCEKSRKDSIATQVRYPKEVFDWYKSSEVHTHKFKLPLQLWLALLIPVFVVGAFWWVFYGPGKAAPSPAPSDGRKAVQAGTTGRSEPSATRGGSTITPGAYYASYKPRIDGLLHTAPRYDAITSPVRAPLVVGCWLSQSDGWCITQQGTRVMQPREFIQSFIANGQFVDFDPGPAVGSVNAGSGRTSSTESRKGPLSAE